MTMSHSFISKFISTKSRRCATEDILEAVISDTEDVSPEQFVRISKDAMAEIESVRFIPPSFSSPSFGNFRVKYHKPKLVTR